MSASLTIREAAEETGLNAHTLRYYERIGLLEAVPRAAGGHRRYRADDLGWVGLLHCLRATGMPIREMQRFAALARGGNATVPDRIALLAAHEQSVLARQRELDRNLETIRGKIAHYRQTVGADGSDA